MASKINWSRYIIDEAIYRFWYILENNNFKHSIKKSQKDAKMSYATMHNALYSGLYYPKKAFEYNHRTIEDIRNNRNINGAIANYMGRAEILKNIHSMYECADFIRKNKTFGYNARLFAKEIYNIGVKTVKTEKLQKVNPKLVITTLPYQDEKTPNVPNRYRLAKSLAKKLKQKGNKLIFSFYTSEERKEKYYSVHTKYIRSKNSFEKVLKQKGFEDLNSILKLEQSLNSGFYKSIIPFFGFEIDNFLVGNSIGGVVKIQELEGNAKKFDLARKQLAKKLTFSDAMENLREIGIGARSAFVKKYRTYPECFDGFLNTFCDMLAKIYAYDNEKLNIGGEKGLAEIANKLIETIKKLSTQYETSTDLKEKKEVEDQIKKIQKALEDSNTHNI